MAIYRESGNKVSLGAEYDNIGDIYLFIGDARRAQASYEESLATYREIGDQNGMLAKVREKHGSKHREIGEIEKLFADVTCEMLMHMQKEEQILFPYIVALERSANGQGAVETPFFQTVRNPIYSMMQDHDAAGELVRKIRAASTGYRPPEGSCTTFKAAYQELQQFEEDLHLHVHLENNVLFPRAVELEAAAV